MTDRDVNRGDWPPAGGRAGRPDWWSGGPSPEDPRPGVGPRPAGRGPGGAQANGWSAPAPSRSPGGYGGAPAPGGPGAYGNGGGASAYGGGAPAPGGPGAGGYGGPGSYGNGAGAGGYGGDGQGPGGTGGPGAYGGDAGASGGAGGYGGSAAPGSGGAGDWSPPPSGAYGDGGPGAPTAVQSTAWGPPGGNAAAPSSPPTAVQSPGWPPTPAPAPGYGPGSSYPPAGGPPYGSPGGYGGPPRSFAGGSVTRHRPGLGLILGVLGAAALVLSLTALAWVEGGGQEMTFPDIRDVYENIDNLDDMTEAPLGAGSSGGLETPPPAPDGSTVSPSEGLDPSDVPTTGEVTEAATNTGKNAYLEMYTAWGWIGVLAAVSLAILFSTLVVPSGKGGRMLTGFLMAGFLGLVLNAADDEGKFGPRASGAILVLLAGGLHVGAVWSLFDEEFAPDPAIGVWAGIGGLAAVFVACLVGTRSERVAAY